MLNQALDASFAFSIENAVSLALWFVLLAVKVFALVDALFHSDQAYVAADKQNKAFWLLLLVIFLALHVLIPGPAPGAEPDRHGCGVRLPGRRPADPAFDEAVLSRGSLLVLVVRHGALRRRRMPLIPGPDGPLEVSGHRLGHPGRRCSRTAWPARSTRRARSAPALSGTRVFFHFRGHGASGDSETPWTYDAAAADVRAVMTAYDARRGLGVSLGAGALLRCAVDKPDAFDRLVFVLPATIDQPREDEAVALMQVRAELVEHRDLAGLTESLVAEQPAGVRDRPDVRLWAERQARRLSSTSVARALRELPPQHPVTSRSELAAVRCPVLVIGQEGDAAHPASIAEELAGLLPQRGARGVRRRRCPLEPPRRGPEPHLHLPQPPLAAPPPLVFASVPSQMARYRGKSR